MPEEFQMTEVECEGCERISFRRSSKPGAVVEVTINNQTVHVEPRALLLAIKTITEEI